MSIDAIRPKQRQLCRGRQACCDLLRHRLTRRKRIAEIAATEIGHVLPKLNKQWLVEPEFDADFFNRLLGRGRACKVSRRIAGERTRQQEGDDHHADQTRHCEQDAASGSTSPC